MDKKNSEINSVIKFCIAGILCFIAAYLSELTLGAVATVPFILILPAIAYLLYRKTVPIAALCALSGFIVKCVFSSDIALILKFTVFCAVFSFISSNICRCVSELLLKKKLKIFKAVFFSLLFIVAFVIYFILYGTIFGNIASNKMNCDYLKTTYPDQNFLIGNTYYSLFDKCYVTEFGFSSRERYSAKVSALTESNAVIDGYRDYISSELMNVVLSELRASLSTIAYEGSDFAIRNGKIDTDDILTSKSTVSEYRNKMCFEIAFYYQFNSEESFEEMCRSYIKHLSEYREINYKQITFYGFGYDNSKDFAYTLDYISATDEIQRNNFDSKNFDRYFSEKDTHKYWELIG